MNLFSLAKKIFLRLTKLDIRLSFMYTCNTRAYQLEDKSIQTRSVPTYLDISIIYEIKYLLSVMQYLS